MRFKETASMLHCDRFKRLITNLLLIATFLLPTKVEAQRTAASQSLVIAGGTLIDGTGDPPLENAVIVIEGERIKSVGKRGEVAIPKGSRVIDVKGKTILPGLIDGHCHLLDFMGELYLHLGITTCPDITQNDDEWTLAQRDGTNLGKIRGPRIWSTGLRLVGPAPAWALRTESGYLIKTPDDARAAVRKKQEMGLEIVKFNEYVSPEAIKAGAEEANRLGLPVTCHCLDVFLAAEAGFAGVEHHWAPGMTSIADVKKRWEIHEQRMTGKINTADLPFYYETENFDKIIKEMVMFVEAGLTPMQAIQAGTINVARTFRKDKDFGTVEPGKVADLIAVEGDPIKDMWAVQNVKLVVMNGRIVDNEFHTNFKNP